MNNQRKYSISLRSKLRIRDRSAHVDRPGLSEIGLSMFERRPDLAIRRRREGLAVLGLPAERGDNDIVVMYRLVEEALVDQGEVVRQDFERTADGRVARTTDDGAAAVDSGLDGE